MPDDFAAGQKGPLVIVEGRGVRVADSAGRWCIDVGGSYRSVNVGYGRPEVAQAAYEQMLRVTPSLFGMASQPAINLARKLADISPIPNPTVFLVRSAYEANDGALRIARAYHQRTGSGARYQIVSPGGDHDAAPHDLPPTLDGREQPPLGDESGGPGIILAPQPNPYRCPMGGRSPFDCAVRCAHAVDDLIVSRGPQTIAAVVAEPVSSAGGALVPGEEYWPMLRNTCDEYGVLLVADEVVTGLGRTGRMFAVEHWDVVPDITTVAIGNDGGHLPLGAVIVADKIAVRLEEEADSSGSVLPMRGHPVSAAAALKTIEIIEDERLAENAAEVGAYFKQQLEGLKIDHPIVGDVRGLGLMLALELVADGRTGAKFPPGADIDARITEKFGSRHLMLGSEEGVVKIGPPLGVTGDDVDEIVHGIDLALWETEGELGIGRPP